jgi:hypothetical protein
MRRINPLVKGLAKLTLTTSLVSSTVIEAVTTRRGQAGAMVN